MKTLSVAMFVLASMFNSAVAQMSNVAPPWKANPSIIEKLSQKRPQFNYDESKVPAYELPDPLTLNSGDVVANADAWMNVRRAELLELFRENVYGRRPDTPYTTTFALVSETEVLGGSAIGRHINATVAVGERTFSFPMVYFAPSTSLLPVPAVVFINNRYFTPVDQITDTYDSFLPVKDLIDRGYAVISFFTSDVDPDRADGYDEGIRSFFASGKPPIDDAWRSLSAWGFAASRAHDYLTKQDNVDASSIAVAGHSRGGKAALWAAAEDDRFAIAYSNQSGCGGAALSRRSYGETPAQITKAFPHWFVPKFSVAAGDEDDLPVDQHELVALLAPRAVYVASADEDLWADPKGEFLSLVHAAPVYGLFGIESVGYETVSDPDQVSYVSPPPIGRPLVVGPTGYHIGAGPHGLTHVDWARFLDFADGRFQ